MKKEIENTKFHTPSDTKKWLVAFSFFGVFTATSLSYLFLIGIDICSLQAFSFIFAATASLLYAVSLAAGSFSYYFGWPDRRSGYQKQIGVLAFWLSCLYCCTLIILYPEIYWYGLRSNWLSADFIFGGAAMTIFAAMVLMNSKPLAEYFKWETIKFVLGLGYVGYALLVVRAILIEWSLWESWLQTFEGYPPGRLILSAIAIGVLLLRISIPVHKSITTKERK